MNPTTRIECRIRILIIDISVANGRNNDRVLYLKVCRNLDNMKSRNNL